MGKRYNGEILGKLHVGANCCTETVKIHPICQDTWHLVPPDVEERKYRYTTLISFDRRQTWEVYYFKFADCSGWVAERNGLYLRMPEKDFERFFGKYEIVYETAHWVIVDDCEKFIARCSNCDNYADSRLLPGICPKCNMKMRKK